MGSKFFGTRVKKLRTDSNMTMAALADELGVTKSRISMWENSSSVPGAEILIKLFGLYHVSVDYLLGNDEMEGQGPDRTGRKKVKMIQRGLDSLCEKDLEKAQCH